MKKLLFWLSGYLPCRLISDGATPYLERYYIAQAFGWTFYLHRFVASDPGRDWHDHPWGRAVSLVLSGWYYDDRRAGTKKVRWFNCLSGDTMHRIILPDTVPEAWTLFAHSKRVKEWGFCRPLEIHESGTAMLWVPVLKHETASWWKTAPLGRESTARQPL